MVTRPVGSRRKHRRWPLLLLLLPFVVMLWPGVYNVSQPQLIGIPFFYWFQILCVILTAILMAILY